MLTLTPKTAASYGSDDDKLLLNMEINSLKQSGSSAACYADAMRFKFVRSKTVRAFD